MITFNYETNFKLTNEDFYTKWIEKVVGIFNKECGEINYIFCDDAYLHKLNVEFLKHDTLTDIISFDYTMGSIISGDIFISVERVTENAILFNQSFDNELNRVVIHGILHFLGLKDKTEEDKEVMRRKEDEMLQLIK